LSIHIPDDLVVTTASLPDGQVGVAYSQTLAATGGVPSYSWSVVSGALPAGLSLNSGTGEISGTPTGAETANFTVEVTDSNTPADTDQQALSITINSAAVLTITTGSLPGDQEGASYNQTVQASGGVTPYRWYIAGGSLPDGLSLDSATGTISGVCYAPGTFDFTVKVWDDQMPSDSDTQSLSISVSAADSDSDGLGDGWEMRYFGDLASGPEGDGDTDGYINLAEYRNGTDPGVTDVVLPYLTTLSWISVGPGTGGAQYSPAIAPNNPDIMFGVCDMGGFHRSTDGGRTFRMYEASQFDRPVTYHPVHCNPTFDPFDENVCFAGSRSGLKRTTDAGDTWQFVSTDIPTGIAIHRGDTSVVLYANSDARVYKSTNRGDNWSELTAWKSSVNELAFDLFIDSSSPTNDLTIYAATDSGMYKSTDDGGSWSSINNGLPSTNISDFNGAMDAGSAVLFLTINSTGVYRSTDGGANWVQKSSGINLGAAGHMELGLCDNDPDILYVGSQENSGPTIYKSSDGGENWTLVLTDPDAGNFPPGVAVERDWLTVVSDFGWGWGEEPHEIMVCPTDPNHIAFAEDGRTWRSNDGGSSWFCCNGRETSVDSNWWVTSGLEPATNYFVQFAPWDHDRVYVTYSDIGLFRSENRGASWRWAGQGSPWRNTFYHTAFDPTVAGKMWACASSRNDIPHEKRLREASFPEYSGGVLRSTDYGATWSDLGHSTGLPTGAPTSIVVDPSSPAGSRTIYVAVMGKGVYKSTDDGDNWSSVNNGLSMPNNTNTHLLKLMSDGTLYCSITEAMTPSYDRYAGGLFKSIDGGANWTQINTSQTLPYICGFAVDDADQDNIYVATMDTMGLGVGGVWKTDNGGTTWTHVFDVFDCYGVDMDPEDHTRIYATIAQGEIYSTEGGAYISEDSGQTWTKLPGYPFERYGPNYTCFDVDDSEVVYITTFGGGVWKSTVPHVTAPVAEFNSTPGPGPLQVTFDSSPSSGTINTYYWQFGDGEVSFETNPVHTYPAEDTYTVTLSVQGTAGSDTVVHQVSTVEDLVITTSSLADGQVGVAYSETLAATGGVTPYSWAVVVGSLPAGLSLNAGTGEISGTPTAYETANFTVEVTDSDAPASTDQQALSITIDPATLVITTSSLADGQVGVAYSETLAATGGVTPYSWAVTVGSLPAGLSLNAGTGEISGTPTAYETANFTVEVTDSDAPASTDTQALSITIDPAALVITTASLADGQVGVAYSETLAATGGVTPYSWAVVVGSLPAGLSLNAGTGEISGTPTAYETANFTVEVTDSDAPASTDQQALSITIDPAALVITTASLPDGQVGVAYSETLAATGGVTPYS
ncbi:MAG: putative Ig domain-containing protein, partial [Planctomycetota bacterium]